MYKRGLVFGKFYPLHNGHINLINQAAMQCETLYVLLSYDKRIMDRDSEFMRIKPITLQDQLKWLSYTFKDLQHIKILYLDELALNIPEYPAGWLLWSNVVKERFARITSLDVIFTADEIYAADLTKYFPKSDIRIIDPDRNEVPISSTLIREKGIYHYWEYLPAIVRRHFLLKVAILGIESTGKTTLTKYLAKRYATSYVAEYGRDYVVNELGGNELALVPEDFIRIAHGHKMREYAEEKTANKVLFIDTTAIETQMYNMKYTNTVSPLIENIILNEEYDLYLIESQDGAIWIDDGIRINGPGHNSEWNDWNELQSIHNTLVSMFLKNKKNIKYLTGSYTDRFKMAVKETSLLLQNKGD